MNFNDCGKECLQGIFILFTAGECLNYATLEQNPFVLRFQNNNGEAILGNIQLIENEELETILDSLLSFL